MGCPSATCCFRTGSANIYDTTQQTLANGADVSFSTNGDIQPLNFVRHTPGSTNITLNETGHFLITWIVFHQEALSAFELTRNSTAIAGTNFGENSATSTLNGQVITFLIRGDVLTLRNIAGSTTLLNSVSGTSVLSASIVIEKLLS